MAGNEYEVIEDNGQDYEIVEDRGPGGFGGGLKPQVNPEAARHVLREFTSSAAGGVAGALTAAAPVPGSSVAAFPVAGGVYYGVNRLLGGEPTAADVALNALSPAGGVALQVGMTPLKAAAVQAGVDVGGQLLAEKTGMTPETPWWTKPLIGVTSFLGERTGSALAPEVPPATPALEKSARRLGLPRAISKEQALELTPLMRSGDIMGAEGMIRDEVGQIIGGIKTPAGPYDRGKASQLAQKVTNLLSELRSDFTAEHLAEIEKRVSAMAPSDASKLAENVRAAVGNAPLTKRITDPDVQSMLKQIGFDPSVTPKSLGTRVDKIIETRVKKDMAAAEKVYEPALKNLEAQPDIVDPMLLEKEMGAVVDNFSEELPSARKFFTPASAEAKRMGTGAEVAQIVSPTGVPLTPGTLPPERTIGEIGKAIRDINMHLRRTPRTPDNAAKLRGMLEFKQALERVGDDFATRNPGSPAAAAWQQYGSARQQYAPAAEARRAYYSLPDDPINIGLAIAKGSSESIPNPILDTVKKFLPSGLPSKGKSAGVYEALEKGGNLRINEVTPAQLDSLRTLPGMTPADATLITSTIEKAKTELKPPSADVAAFVDRLLPLKAEEAGIPSKMGLQKSLGVTDAAWKSLDALASTPAGAQKAQNIRNFMKTKLVDASRNADLTFNPDKFKQVLEAHRDIIPAKDLAELETIGTALMGKLPQEPAALTEALKTFQSAGSLQDFAEKSMQEKVLSPESTKYLMSQLAKEDAQTGSTLAKDFQETVLSAMFNARQIPDPAERLLQFSRSLKDIDPQTLRNVLGNDNWLFAKDVERVVDNMAPLLQTEVSKGQGRNTLNLMSQLRAGTSTAGYLKMGGAALMGMTAPAMLFPALIATVAYPKVLAGAILNPKDPFRKAIMRAAQGIAIGGRAGMVGGEREMAQEKPTPGYGRAR